MNTQALSIIGEMLAIDNQAKAALILRQQEQIRELREAKKAAEDSHERLTARVVAGEA